MTIKQQQTLQKETATPWPSILKLDIPHPTARTPSREVHSESLLDGGVMK